MKTSRKILAITPAILLALQPALVAAYVGHPTQTLNLPANGIFRLNVDFHAILTRGFHPILTRVSGA